MSKTRMIQTKLWSDSWIRKLNPLDRYLFLYLLTNEHTNICGIYELPLSTMAYESGIDERDLEKSMLPRLSPKVYFIDEWVYIKNFQKHQIFNDSVKIGMYKAKKDVPEVILAKIKEIDTECLHPVPPCGVSELKLELKPELISEQPEVGSQVNSVLSLFYQFNPTVSFGNRTQRKALGELIKQLGFDQVKSAVEFLAVHREEQYCPSINTPIELKNKWSKLELYAKKI